MDSGNGPSVITGAPVAVPHHELGQLGAGQALGVDQLAALGELLVQHVLELDVGLDVPGRPLASSGAQPDSDLAVVLQQHESHRVILPRSAAPDGAASLRCRSCAGFSTSEPLHPAIRDVVSIPMTDGEVVANGHGSRRRSEWCRSSRTRTHAGRSATPRHAARTGRRSAGRGPCRSESAEVMRDAVGVAVGDVTIDRIAADR